MTVTRNSLSYSCYENDDFGKPTDLTITVDESWVEDFLESNCDKDINWLHSDDAACKALEYLTCNGFTWVAPEDIGALTDSLLLSDAPQDDDGNYPDDMNVWYIRQYALSAGSVAYQLIVNRSFTFDLSKGA